MKKALVGIVVVFAALGLALSTGAGAGCCAIPQRSAPAAAAGVAAAEKVATLHIEGMTCGSCATAIKHVLTRVDGVKSANVSFEQESAAVTYDPAKVSPEKIARAVEEKLTTYKATVVQ